MTIKNASITKSKQPHAKKRAAAAVSLAVSLSLLLLCAPVSALADDSAAQAGTTATSAPAAQSVNIVLDGVYVTTDIAPYIDGNNRAMIPVQVIGDSIGAKTDWESATKTVTVHETSGGTIELQIGSPTLVVKENGEEKSIIMDTVAVIGDGHTFVPLRFIAEALNLSVGWDAGTHTVFLVAPGSGSYKFTDESVTVDAGAGYPLGGTLSIPDGTPEPYPCVVLVSGSGANDRDETIYTNKPFRDIAVYLASKGIAVLRYDKRTYAYGAKMLQEFGKGATVEEEYIQDAVAAAEFVKSDPRIDSDRVYILGHSEGGMLAPRIDASGGDFAGIVIMAGSPRNLEDIWYDQIFAQAQLFEGTENYDLAMEQVAQIKQGFDSIKAMSDDEAKSTSMNDIVGPTLGGNVSAYYYKEMSKHPAAGYISGTAKPFLVLQGMSDTQISPTVDFKAYEDLFAGCANAELKTYDGLTHLFITATPDDVVGNPKIYTTPGHVDTQVLADIASWVDAN